LIQYRRGGTAYFLDYDALQDFRAKQPEDFPDGISFILPVGLELVEKISLWRKRLLQAGTGREDDEG
jgi:hypothetical protein